MKLSRGLILAVAAVSLASCSSGKSHATSTTTTNNSSAAAGKPITVTEAEFKITLPSKTLAAGTYTFKITNKGKLSHNLTVNGPGVQNKTSSTLTPGSSGDLTVTLAKGSYEFYCSVDSHKEQGMDLTVHVT